MSVRIKGTTNLQEVDANSNALVNLPLTDTQAGFASMLAENDAGTVTGARQMRAVEVSKDFRIRVGTDNMIFNESFPGVAINSTLWSNPVTTMTTTNVNGFAVLNAGLSVAINAVAQLRTYRHFPCFKQYTTYGEMEIQLSSVPVTGNRCEWGLSLISGVSAPTDGAFFRLDSTGTFNGVLNYNGVETLTPAISTALLGVNVTHSYLVYVGSTFVEFWIDNILVGSITRPAGQGATTSSANLPLTFRNYNVSATSTAQVLRIGNVNVTYGDQAMSKPWGHVLSGMGASSTQGQTGSILGSTTQYSNAAFAAAAALSNTTAAVGNIGLGGAFNVLPTLVAGTDGILCSYQVPLGTSTVPGKSLYITDLRINSVVSTTLVGGPVLYTCSLAYGHTAVSLATVESATTKAPRRIPIGISAYAAAAAVAVMSPALDYDLASGVPVIYPGEFIQVVLRNVGTVTTAGSIMFVVSITGFWE